MAGSPMESSLSQLMMNGSDGLSGKSSPRLARSSTETRGIDQELAELHRLANLLESWAEWARNFRPALGYKCRSSIVRGSGNDFEGVLRTTESDICEIIDVAIDDLPQPLACAIHHRYLSSIYRFDWMSYAAALGEAHDRLIVALRKKDVVV